MNKTYLRYFPKFSNFGFRQARALFDIDGLLKLESAGQKQRALARAGQASRWNE